MSAVLPRARRSSLILPVNVPRFVEKAALRGADAVVLDLEDSVPSTGKANARRLVRDALALAGRGGAEVLVRVNNDPALLWDDVEAALASPPAQLAQRSTPRVPPSGAASHLDCLSNPVTFQPVSARQRFTVPRGAWRTRAG
jgi:hypothetical protein